MSFEDSSSESGSSSDEDLDILLLESLFPTKTKANIPRLNIEDVSEEQRARMFRSQNNDSNRRAT